ncbi:MAG: hypothetical protein HC784_04690 [Hydrococcus sp. CSU_1_8]|nr:hypothetical protein [Hydrococcus sp. CSU_1_8]
MAISCTNLLPNLYQQAQYQAEPPSDAITQLLQAIEIGLSPKEATKWLNRALNHQTDYEDTHPCLRDRLMAIDYNLTDIRPPQPPEQTAAKYFLEIYCGVLPIVSIANGKLKTLNFGKSYTSAPNNKHAISPHSTNKQKSEN